jgi:hypothetical protein
MGKFNNKIEAEFTPPKTWVLSRALSYQNDEIDIKSLEAIGVKCPDNKITCKKGFKTDLASTPKILWNLIAPWDVARAAIIHDLLYLRIRQYRSKEGILDSHPNANKVINNVKALQRKPQTMYS